jgi:putative ABC transport system permease protein
MIENRKNILPPRWSKVLSDLWGDKTRTLLVVASITVGVFAIGMIITAYVVLKEDLNLSYSQANPPNIEIWTDPFDKHMVSAIEKEMQVKAAKGTCIIPVRVRRGNEQWQTINLVGVSDFSSKINQVTVLEGTAEVKGSEIAVSEDVFHISGYAVGDVLELKFSEGPSQYVKVAGIIQDQTKSKPDLSSPNYASISLDTLDDFGQGKYFNHLYVNVAGDGGDLAYITEVKDVVIDQIKNSGRTIYRTEEFRSTVSPQESLVLTVMNILLILGIMTTILSSTLIINMLNSLLMQQMRQIGVMKLIGGLSRQVMGMYLILILAYGLISLILAVPLSAFAGYHLSNFIALNSGATLQGVRLIPLAVIAQTFVAFLIPLAAGFFPVQNGAKISVQRAISNIRPSDVSISGGILKRMTKWLSQVSRPFLVSFQNTFRKKGRLLLTIFTLTIAGSVFMSVFNIRGSLGLVVEQLLEHFMGDVTLEFHQAYRVEEIQNELLSIPGVSGVEGWTGTSAELWDTDRNVVTKLPISAPPQDTQLVNLDLSEGRWLLLDEERAIVISDTVRAFYPDLETGDQVIVKLPGRHEEPWTVVGIFPFVSLLGDPIGYTNFDFLAKQNFSPNKSASYRVVTTAENAAEQELIIKNIEQYLDNQNYHVLTLKSSAAIRSMVSSAIGILIGFLLIMAILIAIVGSLGLAGTMSMNVLERTREIGIMRTIGASDAMIMKSVISEGLIIGLITWGLSIVGSFPISSLLATAIGKTLLETDMPLDFSPIGIMIWLVLVIVLSVVASVAPAQSAARLTINEVLAYE